MQLKVKLEGFEDIRKTLDKDLLKKVTGRTIKRTVNKFKTVTTREVRKTYNVKAKDLKKHIKLKRTSNFEYLFTAKSERFGLEKFGARQTKQGVSVRIRKDRGRKVIKGAFLAKDIKGNIRIFKRRYKERLPLDRFYSISIPQMFNKEIVNKGFEEAQKTFEKEFKHNLDYYLGKLK